VRNWTPERIAVAAGADLLAAPAEAGGFVRAVVDSREAEPGALFIGLPGDNVDGGSFAAAALAQGAWGVLVAPEHAMAIAAEPGDGVVLAADDPLAAMQQLATAWRRELGAVVIGITGSTGKTSTKDILTAMLAPSRRVVATPANRNTEIGMPLVILDAPPGTEVLVLEMAMRGAGQIAELARIAEPDVGVVLNVGPVHLELLGSIEAIAATKAELIAGLPPGGTAIIPADEPLLDPHRRSDVTTVTFGTGGDVHDLGDVQLSLPSRHMQTNAMAALAAARAAGVRPHGSVDVALSALRGQRVHLPGDVVVVDDCYNANPMSMRAALDDLADSTSDGGGRRVAVLGDMLELGPDTGRFHAEIGAHARATEVDLLITVGPLAARMGPPFGGAVLMAEDADEAARLVAQELQPGDTVLVKASRGVGLEVVAEQLQATWSPTVPPPAA
jgi:UDP-N-acetylmuramoyl-tripeptide--D-alanyl-D-alanine ligase